ncbi:putative peroxidase 48, partial [Quercus suber]
GENLKSFSSSPLYYSNSSTQSASSSNDDISGLKLLPSTLTITMSLQLSYAFSSTTASLRYYIPGCDASVLLDDSNGDKNHSIERQAIPNQTLRGFDKIDSKQGCFANLRGPLTKGWWPFLSSVNRSEGQHSFIFNEALAAIPRPDDNIKQTFHLFDLGGFDERETVSLLGAHNIGKIGCEFIQKRLFNFKGTGQPDPTIAPDFLAEMRMRCQDSNGTTAWPSSSSMASLEMSESAVGMSYLQALSSSILSGAGFDTHYYRSLLNGRGLLFADQQLMANEKTARLVRAYASDDGSTFRMDFAQAMMKMSGLNLLTGSQAQVPRNCSLPLAAPQAFECISSLGLALRLYPDECKQEKNYLHLNIHIKHSKVKKERAKVKLLPGRDIQEEKDPHKPRAKPQKGKQA